MKQAITSTAAPAAIGPYSQAIRAGNLLFLSGQIPLDPSTGQIVEGGVRVQTLQVMMNLRAVLEAAGVDFPALVKTTIFLQDLADFAVVNEVYASFLQAPFPARATVEVARLPRDVLVEIDGIALLP